MKTARLISWLFLGLQVSYTGYAQSVSASTYQLDSLPKKGVLLDHGWRFQAGDNPIWAAPGLDDSRWLPIDPVRDMRELPHLQRAGIGWLRLTINTGPDLPPVLAYIFQSVASDVYLDGRLLYHFGTISRNPQLVWAYNPYAAYSLPLRPGTRHVLALRIACQPGLDYAKSNVGRLPSAVRINLFPATEIPAIPTFNLESVYLDCFKIGISFILFILHLSLFSTYPKQKANLYAAIMYVLIILMFVLRAACDLTHPVETRMLLYYGTRLGPWISGLTILIFYSLFGLRRGWWFWLAIGSIPLAQVSMPASLNGLRVVFAYYLPVELLRIALVATYRNLPGARVVAVGVLFSTALLITTLVVSDYLPVIGHEWLYHVMYMSMFLCIPLTLSLRLALEHGWTSRQLSFKLHEVEDLSARNQAQQRDKEQLLAQQNEQLERLVDERTQELRRQADQLKELDEAKSRFVTNLTHEFRTPLSLIISPVGKLLATPTLPSGVQTSLQTVDRNARHLLSQVNQLLDIARLEAGHTDLTLQPVLLGQFTAQIADLFHSMADARQIAFTFHPGITDGLYLMDTDKWNKIVYNLLDNAFKFTPSGGHIQSGCQIENGQVCFSVTDTGIGIAANKLPFVFDRFYQADDALNRSYEGTGIGLALVQELTTLLGGSVVVHSEPGAGSTFTVQLPVQVAPGDDSSFTRKMPALSMDTLPPSVKQSAFGRMPQGAIVDTTCPLVLIVEDNADLCRFIADELATRYRVLTADNGRQGWELTQQHLPDIVLSDVMMPMMNGLQLTQQIRADPITDHIAILLITARSTHENRLDSLRSGADEYLVKPFDLAELHLRLANVTTRRQKLQAFYRQQLTQSPDRNEFVPLASEDPFLTHIYSLLESHLSNSQVGVAWLAEQVSMDRKTLYRKLQAKLQLTPHELIRTYRLRRSSDLLRQGKSVTETAYSVGFDNVNYFGQCFKEQYQVTPGDFINQKR